MTKEEIQDWLKRVDKLGDKLDGEDRETLDWLVYGYNYCAKKCLELENMRKEIREYIKNKKIKISLKRNSEYAITIEEIEDILQENNKGD